MRVLLVEDDARIARFLGKGLREESYAVDWATNGHDALYQAEINSYDLFILDVMIPGPDGFAVCRKLREAGIRAPILMLTARDAVDDRITGLDAGADDYLTKPFEFGELLARIRAVSRRRGLSWRSELLGAGPLQLNTRTREAWVSGVPLTLTAREYGLLEYLCERPGTVVSRQEIAETVWGEGDNAV